MSWRDLLAAPQDEEKILPWVGGRVLHGRDRTWKISGKLPREHGWYRFQVGGGRMALLMSTDPVDADPEFGDGRELVRGYIAGGRFIRDGAHVHPDPAKLAEQTEMVYLVELGLDRFARALCARSGGNLIYLSQEFPQGPELEVQAAYQDRKDSVGHIKEVTPALDLAFRWETWQREAMEERARERARIAAEAEARRQEEERRARLIEHIGTGAGRRALAAEDFNEAARVALEISGAELLDARPGGLRDEMVVQYRFKGRRLECVCNRRTLRIIDAGVCLDDHQGTRGDTRFTLESLPGVIDQAMREGRLVVWRHVPGDPGYYEERW